MRRNKRNGQPDEGVCDTQHTVHSDELFVIRQHKRNGQPDEGVCDMQHTVHSDELFVIRQHKRNGQPDQGVCDIRMRFTRPLSSVCDLCGNRSLPQAPFHVPWQPSTTSLPFPLDLELLSHALPPSICLHPSFRHCSIVFSMQGTGRK